MCRFVTLQIMWKYCCLTVVSIRTQVFMTKLRRNTWHNYSSVSRTSPSQNYGERKVYFRPMLRLDFMFLLFLFFSQLPRTPQVRPMLHSYHTSHQLHPNQSQNEYDWRLFFSSRVQIYITLRQSKRNYSCIQNYLLWRLPSLRERYVRIYLIL